MGRRGYQGKGRRGEGGEGEGKVDVGGGVGEGREVGRRSGVGEGGGMKGIISTES